MLSIYFDFFKSIFGDWGIPVGLWAVWMILLLVFADKSAKREEKKEERIKEHGESYENFTANILHKYITHNIINNIILEKKDFTTTEIDMAFVNEKGIFCIECKYHNSGEISGDTSQNEWFDSNEGSVYSPYMQNMKHIQILWETLGKPRYLPIYNIVLNSSPIKIYHNSDKYDDYCDKLAKERFLIARLDNRESTIKDIKKLQSSINMLPNCISQEDVQTLTAILRKYRGTEEQRQAHAIQQENY